MLMSAFEGDGGSGSVLYLRVSSMKKDAGPIVKLKVGCIGLDSVPRCWRNGWVD